MSWNGDEIPSVSSTVSTFVPADGSDVVLFDSATAQLHRLERSAASVWAAIDGRRSVNDIVAVVSEWHDVRPSVAAADVKGALDRLHRGGALTQSV